MPDQQPASFVPDTPGRTYFPSLSATPAPHPASFVPDSAPIAPLEEEGMVGRVVKSIGDAEIGAVKGAGQTAINLGRMVQTVPGVKAAIDAFFGVPGISDQAMSDADKTLTPTNVAQKTGKIAEQVAEVAIPSAAIRKAGVAATAKLAPTLTQSMGPMLAKVLPRALVEAATGAGMAAAQGGSPTAGAVLGGAAPLVGQALEDLPQSLKDAAEKKVVQALGPTKERFKAIAQRLAPQILQRGLGGSREALQQQAASTLETVGDQLDTALQQYGQKPIGVQPVMDALETAKDAFRTTKQIPVAAALKNNTPIVSAANGLATVHVEFEPRAIRQLSSLQTIVQQLGPDATVEQLTGVRRAWDKVVSQAGGYAQRATGAIGMPLKDQSEAFAKREGATAIRQLLATNVPELAAINKEYSFWKNLDDVVTQTLQRTQPQGPGLLKQAAETGGQVVGGLAASPGGPVAAVGGAFAVGKVARMAQTVFTSPRWKLVDARLRNSLADAIAAGQVGPVMSALARITAVEVAKVPSAIGSGAQ